MTHTGDAAAEEGERESFNRRPMEQRTECCGHQHLVRGKRASPAKFDAQSLRPVLSVGSFCRRLLYSTSIIAQERHAVDQPERAKSNQCDQSPTSIAFSGATVTDDDEYDAVAHIIFYGSLSWLSNTCRWAAVDLRAISTLRSQKTDPVCL